MRIMFLSFKLRTIRHNLSKPIQYSFKSKIVKKSWLLSDLYGFCT